MHGIAKLEAIRENTARNRLSRSPLSGCSLDFYSDAGCNEQNTAILERRLAVTNRPRANFSCPLVAQS